jgi:hypothetical protein
MPHNTYMDKQGCNCQFRNHKIFNPRKHRMVTNHPSVSVHVQCIHFRSLCVASLSAVIYLLFDILPVVFLICFHSFLFDYTDSASVLFVFSVRLFIVIFLLWYLNCIPGILIHITPYQQPSCTSINIIHQTAHLSQYRKQGPTTIIDISGYPEPISSIGSVEGETHILRYCFMILLLSEHSTAVFLIWEMYSRYFFLNKQQINNNYIASLLNKHHTSQDMRLLPS